MNTPISFKSVPSLNELKSGFPNLKALFFDMDGTLFNTEGHHAQALEQIGAEFQIRPPHSPEVIHGMLVGKADHLVFEIIKDWEGFPKDWTVKEFIERKNKNLLTILDKADPHSYIDPGILKLLNDAQNEDLYLALVTSSEKVITEELLKLTKLRDYFKQVLTRDDCPRHKPDPWPYFKAMEVAGIDHIESIIFEDSHVGLEAATLSGAHVIKAEWY